MKVNHEVRDIPNHPHLSRVANNRQKLTFEVRLKGLVKKTVDVSIR